jgi:DNA polymerase
MGKKFLLIRLPSGRRLSYPCPTLSAGSRTEIQFYGQRIGSHWGTCSTYGGKLVENITQAVARDCMAHGMLKATANGFPIIATVHDEILAEVDADDVWGRTVLTKKDTPEFNLSALDNFALAICQNPGWGEGIPLAAEGYIEKQYKK